VSTSAVRVRRLTEIFTGLRPELPGEWSVRGKGIRTLLVQDPIEWTVAWIGYDGSPTRPVGWLSAGVQPLVEAFNGFDVRYGTRMDGRPGKPQTIDLTAGNALDVAREFIFDVAVGMITRWPAERLAEVAEKDYALEPRRRGTHWHQLPGWRVVFDSGSPVEPAAELGSIWEQKARDFKKTAESSLRAAAFCRNLSAAYESGGRDAALALLEKHRAELVAEQRLDVVVAP
jgi:hypothetical protein